jgi:ubiquitin-conjugating enzyme E2 J1
VREAQELSSSPSADYTATPLENDLFEWHFTLRGPPKSSFADGIYHGRIVLPPTYPLRPPSFRFSTPSGRFEPNREICLSISGHHEETWQPAWGVRTALVALRSFMETDPKGQLGGLDASDAVRRRLAAESGRFRCAACGGRTNTEIMATCEEDARVADEERAAQGREKSAEVEVPSDLKMGWRDEMEAKNKQGAQDAAAAATGSVPQDDAETAELAEGFVQTAPLPQTPQLQHRGTPVLATGAAAARPGQTVPQPTRTVQVIHVNTPAPNEAQRQRQRAARVSAEVPVWIDALIGIISVLLFALVMKVFLS